jgi:hypothetical protein
LLSWTICERLWLTDGLIDPAFFLRSIPSAKFSSYSEIMKPWNPKDSKLLQKSQVLLMETKLLRK